MSVLSDLWYVIQCELVPLGDSRTDIRKGCSSPYQNHHLNKYSKRIHQIGSTTLKVADCDWSPLDVQDYNGLMLTEVEEKNNSNKRGIGLDIENTEDLVDSLHKMVGLRCEMPSPFHSRKPSYVSSPLTSPTTVKLNRQSSWKTPKKMMRRVSFADSVGLELASIRIMTEGRDTPPDLEGFHEAHRFGGKPIQRRQLQPIFMQPIQDYGSFYNRLKDNSLALESVAICNNVISGVVKVKNIAYVKEVNVHYTTDGWSSQSVTPCFYINSMNKRNLPNHVDAFLFQFEVASSCEKLDFCIEYRCAGQTYWDNNQNSNYTVVSLKK